LDLTSSEQKRAKKAGDHIRPTSSQNKPHYLSKIDKTVLFDRKIFLENSKKTACALIKLAQKNATRNSKKFPATHLK